jgi:phage shock PspC-like protein
MGDTIIIKLNPSSNSLKALNFDNFKELDMDRRHNNGYDFGEYGNKLSIIGFANLDVIESTSDSVELIVYQSAKGNTKKEANENAKAIHYSYRQVGNELIFDEIFSVEAGSKFRAQELDIKLKLPKGKVIYFDKSVKHLLDDVDNTTNTWDGDMISRRWQMTDKGLKCIDCDNLNNIGDYNDHDEYGDEIKTKNITINDDGIKVNGKDAEIKIDDDGIRIKTADKDWEIKNSDEEKKENKQEHKEYKKEHKK